MTIGSNRGWADIVGVRFSSTLGVDLVLSWRVFDGDLKLLLTTGDLVELHTSRHSSAANVWSHLYL